jgi:hypothetical protein
VLGLTLSGCWLERREVSYTNMQEALEHGAVDRGWIPDWIPLSATNIREIHDLDTNESMMAFELPRQAKWQLPSDCKPVPYGEIGPPRFDRSWWPSNAELERSYSFHRCTGDDPWTSKYAWVARHRSGDHALHWRAYAL